MANSNKLAIRMAGWGYFVLLPRCCCLSWYCVLDVFLRWCFVGLADWGLGTGFGRVGSLVIDMVEESMIFFSPRALEFWLVGCIDDGYGFEF